MKYQNWLNEWLTTCVEPVVKERTFERYTAIVRLHIVPKIGGYEMSALTPQILQSFTAELSKQYASNTVCGIVNVIKSSLVQAQEMLRVKKQYSNSIKYPKPDEKLVECFNRYEQKKIEQFILNTVKPKLYGVLICLYTGLRIGELLALEWQDIDFATRKITITKNCVDRWNNGRYIKTTDSPKTSSSIRKIPLPAQLIPHLKALKKHSKSNFVISGTGGEAISIRSYQKTFEGLLKKLNIPHRGFHTLRHTFATRALECGMDVKSLSKILGHKSSVITLNRYAHSFWEHQNSIMNRLGKMLTADTVNY